MKNRFKTGCGECGNTFTVSGECGTTKTVECGECGNKQKVDVHTPHQANRMY